MDAVSLDVPVKVHGSRIVEVVRGTTAHTEPFEEQTSTMIIFPLGGVLKMATPVNVGQAVVITNLRTRQDAICRVVKVRTNPNLHSYVEVEFSHPQPGYWGVRFSSDGPEPPKQASSPEVAAPAAPPPAVVPIASISPTVPPPAAPTASVAPVSFSPPVSAPAPRVPQAAAPVAPVTQVPAEPPKQVPPAVLLGAKLTQAPAPRSASESVTFDLDQLKREARTAPPAPPSIAPTPRAETVTPESTHEAAAPAAVDEPPATHEAPTLGRFAATTLGAGRTAHEDFGARLDTALGVTSSASDVQTAEGKNSKWIAAVAIVLIAAAGAGGYYFLHAHPGRQALAVTAPPAPELRVQPQPATAANAALGPASVQQPARVTPAPQQPERNAAASASSAPIHPREAESAKPNTPAAIAPAQLPARPGESAQARSKTPPAAVPDMFGALNAHPTAQVRQDAATPTPDAAPSIGSAEVPAGQALALPSSESSVPKLAPPPQPVPEGPVTVGGNVKPPQLVYAPDLVYPDIARETGVEGDVVVRVTIDKSGNVTQAQVISGPMLLRGAAINAMRQRKYSPSKLDGHPISVVMVATVRFHR
ncbi:MAG TPA: TonB family protein [Candidatus Aquilonibacter sp.]|nr:TonB family protein [Candidatus Aquilonibacter sp.]